MDPGVVFDNSFVPISACCPDRATLDTGQYAQNTTVLGNAPQTGGIGHFAESTALPVWLNNAAYMSTHIGKYLNGFGKDPSQPITSPYNPAHVPPGWTTAQFGSGMIKEVSTKLLGQFVECLEQKVSAPAEVDAVEDEAAAPAAEAEPLRLMSVAGPSIYKRAMPVVVVVAIIVALIVYAIVK